MKAYSFYLHDGLAAIPHLMIEFLPSSDEALAYGRRLLRHPTRYTTVEISQGEFEVAILRDDDV